MLRKLLLVAVVAAAYLNGAHAAAGAALEPRNGWNDFWNDVTDTFDDVTDFFNDLGDSLTDAAQQFGRSIQNFFNNAVGDLLSNVQDLLQNGNLDWNNKFDQNLWNHLASDAKLVINQLGSALQDALAEGLNLLEEFIDDDLLPYPLNVVTDSDLQNLANCMDTSVRELQQEFVDEVAANAADVLGGNFQDVDIAALLNTDRIDDALADMYSCMRGIANDIESRKTTPDVDGLTQQALDWFEFPDTVVSLELALSACEVVCVSGSLGFAVSTDASKDGVPFLSVSGDVELDGDEGFAPSLTVAFHPSLDTLEGGVHRVQFGGDLTIFSVTIPDAATAISDDGKFRGFVMGRNLLADDIGQEVVFQLGYGYALIKKIDTLLDKVTQWVTDVTGRVTSEISEQVNEVIEHVKDALNSGGFLSSVTNGGRLQMQCPSTEDEAGSAATLTLSLINIAEAHLGNIIDADNFCNDSRVFDVVSAACQYTSLCSVDMDSSEFAGECQDAVDSVLEVIHTCPDTMQVFDAGCYATATLDVSGWLVEGLYDILDGDAASRDNALAKCAKVAMDAGYKGFALLEAGQCVVNSGLLDELATAVTVSGSASLSCSASNGKGDVGEFNVYVVSDPLATQHLGCYSFENLTDFSFSLSATHVLSASGSVSLSAQCAQIALDQGYPSFGMSNGQCFVSFDFSAEAVASAGIGTDSQCTGNMGSAKSMDLYTVSAPYANAATDEDTLSGGAIAAIVLSVLLVLGVLGYLGYRHYKGQPLCCCQKSAADETQGSNYARMNGH